MKLAFDRATRAAFLDVGFYKRGKVLRFDVIDVSLLVNTQKVWSGRQHFINVGFWLHPLGPEVPDKVELTHLYYRLERLFPAAREQILAAGAGGEEREEAVAQLSLELKRRIVPDLSRLASVAALKAHYVAGRLSDGLIRKEARAFLEQKL